MRATSTRVAVAVVLVSLAGAVAAAERVGVAAVVLGVAFKSAEEGKLGERLKPGESVFVGERISTGSTGRVQLLLTDQSAFVIGPQSSMVMDEYVYDAKDDDRGSILARFVTGAFRFITGKVAAKRPRSMRMNAGGIVSIGIRGTSGVTEVPPATPIPAIQIQNVGGGGTQVTTEYVPFQQNIPPSSVSAALLSAGSDPFGQSNGAFEMTANGNSLFISNPFLGGTFLPDGSGRSVPALDITNRILPLVSIPPGPGAGPPGSTGRARASGGSNTADSLDSGFQGSAVVSASDPIVAVVNDLGSQGNQFGGILTNAQLPPGVVLQQPGIFVQTELIQNNGLIGQADWQFSINTSSASGSVTVAFQIETGMSPIAGSGSASFQFGQNQPLVATNLPLNVGGNNSGTVTGFAIQNLSSSNGQLQPHFVGSAVISHNGEVNPISGTTSTRFDLQ